MLDRMGGEARQLTELKLRISDYQWSPDSKRLALVMREADEPEAEPGKPAPQNPSCSTATTSSRTFRAI